MAAIHRERAERLYREGRIRDAVAELEQAYGHDSRDARTLYLLAEIYGAAGFIDPAVDFIQKSLREDYSNVDGWVMLANLYAQKGGGYLELALEQLELAEGLNPDHPNIHYLRGNVLAQKGDVEKARESLRKALELDSDHPYARHDLEALSAG